MLANLPLIPSCRLSEMPKLCQTGVRMYPPDFQESLDPDSWSKKLWLEVPESIRKDVEQHVTANLPAELLAKLRDLHARGIPISTDDGFFHFGGGMTVRNLAENGSLTTSWQPTACFEIGTT